MEREFEKFRGGPTLAPSDRIYVTINKENVIGINQNCYRMLGKPPAVFLYFSRTRDCHRGRAGPEPASARSVPRQTKNERRLARQRLALLESLRHPHRHNRTLHQPRDPRRQASSKTLRNRHHPPDQAKEKEE